MTNTETLAEIYVKQGNYPKAIEIYEQLMLSNPEKTFFASRIKYIKLKHNHNMGTLLMILSTITAILLIVIVLLQNSKVDCGLFI